jgi:RNA polymerase sigma-70 factor (family 1)
MINDEKWLLAQLKAGNSEAFSQLYRHYSGPMYVNVLKMVKDEQVTEEIVQDIFARIWQKRESIQFEKSFASYIYRVAQNMVFDFYRKLKRDRNLYEHFKTIATENYSHIEEELHGKEFETLLHKALDTLSPQQKKVYQLCSLEGRSYKEAGIQLGISSSTVKEHLAKAKLTIRRFVLNKMDTILSFIFFIMIKDSLQ